MASCSAIKDSIKEHFLPMLVSRSASCIASEMADKHLVTSRHSRRYLGKACEIIHDDIDVADIDRQKLVSQLVHELKEAMEKQLKRAIRARLLALPVNCVNYLI